MKITDPSCGLRLYSRRAAESLTEISGHSYTLQSLLMIIDSSLSHREISIYAKYFKDRRSVISGNLFKYAAYIFRVLVSTWALLYAKSFLRLAFLSLTIGIILITEFMRASLQEGKFSGNLYLGGSGAFATVTSLLCLNVFFILTVARANRIEITKLSANLIEISSSLTNRSLCEKCIK